MGSKGGPDLAFGVASYLVAGLPIRRNRSKEAGRGADQLSRRPGSRPRTWAESRAAGRPWRRSTTRSMLKKLGGGASVCDVSCEKLRERLFTAKTERAVSERALFFPPGFFPRASTSWKLSCEIEKGKIHRIDSQGFYSCKSNDYQRKNP